MFFTIAIPVYNAEKYLDKCISSVMNQTERDFELILVDDGSSDQSYDVCKKWESEYPNRIRVIKKQNSGSLFTRRVCLKESKGEYIYIMDADDYLLDIKMLEKIKKAIFASGADLIFFNCTINQKTQKPYYQYKFEDFRLFENEGLLEIYKLLLETSSFNTLWTKIFSRDLVDWGCDYTPYTDIVIGTDLFQVIPIVAKAKKVLYLKEVFYYCTKSLTRRLALGT